MLLWAFVLVHAFHFKYPHLWTNVVLTWTLKPEMSQLKDASGAPVMFWWPQTCTLILSCQYQHGSLSRLWQGCSGVLAADPSNCKISTHNKEACLWITYFCIFVFHTNSQFLDTDRIVLWLSGKGTWQFKATNTKANHLTWF